MAVAEIDEVLDLIGFGWIQVLMFLACTFASIFIVNEIIGINVVSVDIACEFSLSSLELSMLSSAGFAGLILGSHYSGFKTDQIGRRKVMMYSLCMAVSSSMTSIFMPTFYLFALLRFMTGLFVSGASCNNITYMSEYTKAKYRASIINFMCYAFAVSAIYLPLVAYMLTPMDRVLFTMYKLNWQAWRLSMLINMTPGILAIIFFSTLPESAKFLLSIGQDERAYQTINRLYKSKRKQDLTSVGITGVTDPNSPSNLEDNRNCCVKIWRGTAPLFRQPLVGNFLICTTILCGFLFVGSAISLWFMELRQLMGSRRMTVCDMLQNNATSIVKAERICPSKTSNFIDSVVLGATFLGCSIAVSLFLLCMRHFQILFMFTTLATICGLSLNMLVDTVPILVATALFTTLCTSCIPLISSVLLDLMPTHIRGMAISMGFLFARISVILANILMGFCMVPYCLLTFNLFVLITLVVAILSCTLPKS
ncbi:PREDICTED: putative transporter svop-1 isoform X1 [Drosophila arizonae]|uniref:Transporter svop-1 isoform X1 n=1 Tax=Drosophila arizonae TaxID=7263 RepID=A0ABM1P2Q7_DROAR|nr:PREDICTED: putative transporter svop-1 isoform X1 [Drosophila arizonae]